MPSSARVHEKEGNPKEEGMSEDESKRDLIAPGDEAPPDEKSAG